MDRRRAVGVLLVLVSACAFGSGALFAKPAYAAGIDWLTLLAWRFAIGAVLAWCWVFASAGRRAGLRRMTRPQVLGALGLGALYTLNSGTYYAALQTVPASLAALIVYIYPVIVAVLTLRIGQPLEGRRPWLALAIATLGVVLAIGGIDPSAAPPISGILLVLASPIIYAGWIVLSARLAGERRDRVADEDDAGAAIFWSLGLASSHPIAPAQIPAAAWPGIVGVAVISTFVAIQTFYAGATRVGAAQAALISTIEPAYTIVLASILLGESLSGVQLAGAVLVLGAVVLAQTGVRGPVSAVRLRLADE